MVGGSALTGNRNISLDLVKAIAVLGVIMAHVCGAFVVSFGNTTTEFFWANILDSISRACVPLFIMVSGALFLDETKPFSLGKSLVNMAVLIVVWSAFYTFAFDVVALKLAGQVVTYEGIVSSLMSGPYHIWYLYMSIGLYLATPILKAFVKKENKKLVRLYIVIAFVAQFITTYCDVAMLERLNLGFFTGYIAYFLLGWYVVHVGVKWKPILYLSGVASIAITVVYVLRTGDYDTGYSNFSPFIFLYSFAVFTFIYQLKVKSRRIVLPSRLSFGVYITHVALLNVYTSLFPYNANPLAYIIIAFLMVTLLSFLLCYLLSKIPILKKLIRC